MSTDWTDQRAHDDPDRMQPGVCVARGNIYLSRETSDTYFANTVSVALLMRDGNVLIVPLMAESGGGLLLKIRNARGDRVIHAQEFFRQNGFVEEWEPRIPAAQWSEQSAAMVLSDIPRIVG